jgi:hypothetical protein
VQSFDCVRHRVNVGLIEDLPTSDHPREGAPTHVTLPGMSSTGLDHCSEAVWDGDDYLARADHAAFLVNQIDDDH